MPIQYAFSTVACPDWTIEQVAEQAKAMGYTGVELRTLGGGSSQIASDPALSSPAKVKAALDAAGIEPICLSTSCAVHHADATELFNQQRQIREYIDMAAEMNCPAVRIFGLQVEPGQARRSVIERMAANVAGLADKAGEAGVQLLFENAGSFCTSKEWWWLLDVVDHPMLGLVWNIANSAAADSTDRGGWISVPTLNSRIRIAKVKDTELGSGSGFVPLGEGTVDIENFLKRLRGVGYEGYISVEWDRLWLPALEPAEDYLPDAIERLKAMQANIDEWMDKGRKAEEKYTAKNAPKSRAELKAEEEKKIAKAKAAAEKAKAAADKPKAKA